MEQRGVIFEESLSDEWSKDLGVREVPLDERPLVMVGLTVLIGGLLVLARIAVLGIGEADAYAKRGAANRSLEVFAPAPRGLIEDRNGEVLAENRAAYAAVLLPRNFFERRDLVASTIAWIEHNLGVPPEEVWTVLRERGDERATDPVVLKHDLSAEEIVKARASGLPALAVREGFARTYPDGRTFSAVLGYVGYPTAGDLRADDSLRGNDVVGKTGLEAYYDRELRGTPGASVRLRDARGNVLGTEKKSDPRVGDTLRTTLDAGLQRYFAERFRAGLRSLGRTSGAGIAMDPRTGEVLALMSFPSYDNNVLVSAGRNDEKRALLQSDVKPLFNRAVSGVYSPGSTIKPLHALAALVDGVVTSDREVFSPGYLDVPNPYDPSRPSRFLDWRYQGNVDLASAIAQSSNVYFYLVGGGSPGRGATTAAAEEKNFGITGLGISRLRAWWEKFGLDRPTGIDLPGEATGNLPSAEEKETRTGTPWLLGDTYNVAIGQGDLAVTPLELLNYIAAVANGGVLYRPRLGRDSEPEALAELALDQRALGAVRRGMRETVTSVLGTANTMADLPIRVAAKTGSAQIAGNTRENAFFVGYAPAEEPRIAVLVLVEDSREGSLNAVPIARDVFAWYAQNRLSGAR